MPQQPPLSGFEELFSSQTPPSSQTLRNFPHLSRDILTRNAKWFGLAGEHLVDSILLRFGIYTSELPEMLPADRIAYHAGCNLRLQIKTACRARNGYFHFNVVKGYHRSLAGVKSYDMDDFDLVALVALSANAVKFTADRQQAHRIALSELRTLRTDPCRSLDRAIEDLGLTDDGTDIPTQSGGVQ